MDRYRQKIPGFTLVELMVTVAVIAVILVIGVPSIANMKRSGDLTTTSRNLVVALNFARAEAVRQGADITVASKAGDTDTDFTTGWHVKSGATVVRTYYDLPTGGSVTLTTGSAPITFAGLGNVAAFSCFDVSVAGTSAVRSVPISASGRVATCRASCTAIAGDPTKCD